MDSGQIRSSRLLWTQCGPKNLFQSERDCGPRPPEATAGELLSVANLTAAKLRNLNLSSGNPAELWDARTPGLCLRVLASGRATWTLRYRPHSGDGYLPINLRDSSAFLVGPRAYKGHRRVYANCALQSGGGTPAERIRWAFVQGCNVGGGKRNRQCPASRTSAERIVPRSTEVQVRVNAKPSRKHSRIRTFHQFSTAGVGPRGKARR